jgi:hypothetical protein
MIALTSALSGIKEGGINMNCFMQDNDDNTYIVPVARRDYFLDLLALCEEHGECGAFSNEFNEYITPYPINNYCFDNTRLIEDSDAE